MGALTDHRKRCSDDLLLPLSDYSLGVAKSKRQKFGDSFHSADYKKSPPPQGIHCPSFCGRPVHAPQKIIKAFRLSAMSAGAKIRVSESFMLPREKSPPSMEKSPPPSDSGERMELELEVYMKLVENLQSDGTAEFVEKETPGEELTVIREEETQLLEKSEEVVRGGIPLYVGLYAEARKRNAKLDDLAFKVKLMEIKVSEFGIKPKEEPKEDLLGPFTPLTDDEEEEVRLALRDCSKSRLPKHEVLVLHEPSNIEITRDVLQCLRHGAWLNDEVINLFFELLKEREKREPEKFLKCHFFNTFFFKKLTGGRGNYDFKAVRRWTTQRKLGYGLIDCDKIFVPIHKEIHWCLAVIDVKNEKLIYLDSLGGWDQQVLSLLSRYLQDEAKDKSNMALDVSSWKQVKVNGLPLQENGWDCGMFMIKYADFMSRGLDLCFQQENMTYFRKRTAKEILRLRAD